MNRSLQSTGMTVLALILAACAQPGESAPATFRSFGTLREVLRDGHHEGRVALTGLEHPGTVGVGALEGLAGEVTIDSGIVHVAGVEDGRLVQRGPTPADRAALLAVAEVRAWEVSRLPAIDGLEELAELVRERVGAEDDENAPEPVAVRIAGRFAALGLHVIAGACPHADPDGPPPWRLEGADAEGVLVGFFFDGPPGILTHHGESMHLHAVITTSSGDAVTGHLDRVRILEGATLQIPKQRAP